MARGDEAEQEQAAKDLGAAMKQLTNEAQDIAVQVQERAARRAAPVRNAVRAGGNCTLTRNHP